MEVIAARTVITMLMNDGDKEMIMITVVTNALLVNDNGDDDDDDGNADVAKCRGAGQKCQRAQEAVDGCKAESERAVSADGSNSTNVVT